MAPVPAISVRLGGPRTRVLSFLVIGSVFVVYWKWHSLSWLARGMILAAYGVVCLGAGLIPALRARGLLKSGAQAQGTVVDVEKTPVTDTAPPTARWCGSPQPMAARWSSRRRWAPHAAPTSEARSRSAIVSITLSRPRSTAPLCGFSRRRLGWLAGWGCWWPRSSCTHPP